MHFSRIYEGKTFGQQINNVMLFVALCGVQRHFSNISTSHFTDRSALFCVAHIDFQSQVLMAIYQFISLSAWNLVFWLVRQIPTHFEATGSNNDMFDRLQIAIRRASDKRNSQSFKWQCNTSGDYNHFFSFFSFFLFFDLILINQRVKQIVCQRLS